MNKASDQNSNADQIAFWNGPGGQQWATNQENMDANLRPFSVELLRLALPVEGERVLDVGCGCGDTTLMLSQEVGISGAAVGLDISEPMISRARERAKAAKADGQPSPSFIINDASQQTFETPDFDLLCSRFGVMFFSDPPAAFANMRKALRPGGRMAFICWQPMNENPFFMVPTLAALSVLPAPEPPEPDAPGPFAFGDKDRTHGILESAGFSNITIDSLDYAMEVGNGRPPEEAAIELVKAGPVARLAAEASEDKVAELIAAVGKALADHVTDGVVRLGTKTWLVSATNP